MTKACPCGSGLEFSACCEPLLQKKKRAATAQALMRSRYAAYVENDIEYLEKTLLPRKRGAFSALEVVGWNADVDWKSLEILALEKGEAGDDEGVVEFRAAFDKDGEASEIHERSLFKKKAGVWYYVEGAHPDEAKEETAEAAPKTPKVGRNEPCPCGSGKKYKRCCGA